MSLIERLFESLLFRSRWLLAPLYLGMVLSLVLLVIKFVQKFIATAMGFLELSSTGMILDVLGLVDIVLIGNLLLIVLFSGYENFVSKLDVVKDHVDKPEWMGKVGYSDVKLKIIGSVVAISTIELLRAFMNIGNFDKTEVAWMIGLHLCFVVSGVLFALMERLAHRRHFGA
ncbi:TIGR00645 family protein [Rhabdochromatium marinum]|uniref:TIGR00645 family protein n=1 Tax=Rhabdochromatium marinum TaxID=48729 RepID=UPI001905593B|nr:TIGR00645 family protein [Rhabdochromatium marinum]MBK1647636.1 TIGR00645 family protein [Rhabdochromatium marinum]